MTPAERAVIDAARALEPDLHALVDEMATDDYGNRVVNDAVLRRLEKVAPAFLAAVRALPRPLSEQLAELRVGAVVEDYNQSPCKVLANLPDLWLLVVEVLAVPYCPREVRPYNGITRIISNPEASNG